MLELLKTETHSIVLYGCGNVVEMTVLKSYLRNNKIIFSGSKEELLSKPEEWYEIIVESGLHPFLSEKRYRYYKENDIYIYNQAKDSFIHSAISTEPGEHYLIVKIKN